MEDRLLHQVASVSCSILTGTLAILMLDVLGPRLEDIAIDTLTLIFTTLTAVGAIWAADVLNFMELLGYLVKIEAIDVQAIWESFGVNVVMYWALCKPAIEKERKLRNAPWSWTDFAFLNDRMSELLDQRGGAAANLSTQDLRAFAQYEAVIGTDEEQPDPFAIFRRPPQPF